MSQDSIQVQMRSLAKLRFHFTQPQFTDSLMNWYEPIAYPWRERWKSHQDPYHVWLSEIMLQQTLIKVVVPAYIAFLERFPTVESLALGSDEEVRSSVRGLGYYRRFRSLHQAAKELVASGPAVIWPQTFDDWKKLPGVGDYTAAAVSSIAFGVAAPVVDGNVERVLCRVFDLRVPSNLPPLKKIFFKWLEQLICEKHPGDFNQAIMELGQQVCTLKSPGCEVCPFTNFCLAYKNKSQDLAPAAKIKKQFVNVDMEFHVFFEQTSKDIALILRGDSARFLKGSSGFASDIKFDTQSEFSAHDHKLAKKFIEGGDYMGKFKHSITHHRITGKVYSHQLDGRCQQDFHWVAADQVEEKLISNLDRKVWRIMSGSIL